MIHDNEDSTYGSTG